MNFPSGPFLQIIKMEETQLIKHFLVPEHVKLSDEEKKNLLQKYNISLRQLPMINIKDPAIKNLSLNVGDVIRIRRSQKNPKEEDFFRVVVDG